MTVTADQEKPDAVSIAQQLRELRLGGAMSLAQVAMGTGVSEATMSRIENGRSDVSAPHLMRLADWFGVDVARFFQPRAAGALSGVRAVTRNGGGRVFETDRLSSTLLCAELQAKRMHPFLNRVRCRSVDEAGGLAAHDGEEFILVQTGRLELHSAAYAPLLLAEGEAVYFDARMPHAYVSADPGGVEFLVVCTSEAHNEQKDSTDGPN